MASINDRSDSVNPAKGGEEVPSTNSRQAVPKTVVPSDSLRRDIATPPNQRILAQKKMQTRRLWVFRTVLILSLSAVLLCFLVMWRRDKLNVAGYIRSLSEPVAALQAQVDELGRLPAFSSELSQCNLAFYASDSDRFYASQVSEPMIIAYTRPVQRFLQEDGRVVVIYQQGKLETEWKTASEFEDAWDAQKAKITLFEQQLRQRLPVLP